MNIDLFILKQAIIEASDVSVLGVLKYLYPAFDEVKFEEAVKLARSKRWLRYHIKEGNLTQIRHGEAKNSPIYYSRREIAALMQAEREFSKYNNNKG
ncbi:MAG: hypothetical protein LBT43_19625 [Prevotella sp.]|jgi:hypothetical protein|nr:hypothetical protein [Prevotella sp.]